MQSLRAGKCGVPRRSASHPLVWAAFGATLFSRKHPQSTSRQVQVHGGEGSKLPLRALVTTAASSNINMSSAKKHTRFPIGTPGEKWGEAERQQWRNSFEQQRDYFPDVVSRLHRLPASKNLEIFQYGELDYRRFGSARFPLYAVKSMNWSSELPFVAITGGCHGYETSGVHGALDFIENHFESMDGKINLLILPCMSPWGYENIQRWTPEAVDPNRQFKPENPGCEEAKLAMAVIEEHAQRSKTFLLHMDLHETTDTDNTNFTPAKFARDGLTEDQYEKFYEIPDGFYVFGDTNRKKNQLKFSQAIIDAVSKVTHIAEPEEDGTIVSEPIASHGVLLAPGEGTCDAHTKAMYVTTTEVYPDSKRTNPEECNKAQSEAVRSGIEYALANLENPTD